ncbi:formimidoylglutamate deiminase [Govanella unica]|uniref:Formimidoylglutamate deiminase n=1 Tax=Govanella unica TaxID=2975056 RepID=A0A9X3TUF2_9PROT|nr:formimidoylglutamate deiminase [Govania unica]MDA5192425.1 formimidoylglutamate deiminase [Govania unica]
MTQNTTYQFDLALFPHGWQQDARITVDASGTILATADDVKYAEHVPGVAIPGMPNSHSHAFQRAMAGLTEYRAAGRDNFWSWRERMYDFALRLTPADATAIAAQLYVEMLKAGYTTVAEFHYLHHDPAGKPYADRSVMAKAILDAAHSSGIGLTLLPTLYMTSDFGGLPPTEGQRRFINSTDAFLDLYTDLTSANGPQTRVGVALHSLRAVPPEAVHTIVTAVSGDPSLPVHIHAAEQMQEVEACLATLKARPVEWLLDNTNLGPNWCLIHATHMTADETRRLAASGAVAAVCPSTEGNLGDGFFPLIDYMAADGQLAIGTDSHISISPPEELRWLEYAQRLQTQSRNVMATDHMPHTGVRLWTAALEGGARASGRPVGKLAPGQRADILVLDPDSPALCGLQQDQILDGFVFSGQPTALRHVMAGGRWVVRDGLHRDETDIAARYRQTMKKLLSV